MPRPQAREVPRKRFICKICKVPVISATNHKALLGKEHKSCCPRRNK